MQAESLRFWNEACKLSLVHRAHLLWNPRPTFIVCSGCKCTHPWKAFRTPRCRFYPSSPEISGAETRIAQTIDDGSQRKLPFENLIDITCTQLFLWKFWFRYLHLRPFHTSLTCSAKFQGLQWEPLLYRQFRTVHNLSPASVDTFEAAVKRERPSAGLWKKRGNHPTTVDGHDELHDRILAFIKIFFTPRLPLSTTTPSWVERPKRRS